MTPILRVFQTKGETRAFYDKIAKVYDVLAEHSEAPVRLAALEKLHPAAGERILEIGPGTGHCLAAMAREAGSGGRIIGIDLPDGMIAAAKAVIQEEGVGDRISLLCGDAAHIPLQSGSLDGVFMTFTLELFDTPEIPAVLAECKRVLKPGGRLVVAAMSKESEQGLAVEIYEWSHRHFPNFVDCRPIYARRMIEEAGFEIVDTVTMHIWLPVEIVTGQS